MATDVTRDELEAALAATGVIVGEARLLHTTAPSDSVFLAAVRYPGAALAEELLASTSRLLHPEHRDRRMRARAVPALPHVALPAARLPARQAARGGRGGGDRVSGLSQPPRDRLFSRLIIDPDTGCLLWTGAKNNKGYGRISINYSMQYVHRVMYAMFAGEIPDGLQLDHLCRVRHCANVAHLEPVTGRENILRGNSPAATCATATHCPAGHEYDLLNTAWTTLGTRKCRACNRERLRRRYWRARPQVAP